MLASLGEVLRSAGYTVADVARSIGLTAHAALSRNETVPAMRATRDGSVLSTLTRLWLLQSPVRLEEVERALPEQVEALCALGVLERSVDSVRAVLDVRPYAEDDRDWWVVSDLTPGLDGAGARVSSDYVLGVSPASTSLAQITVREPVACALDLGTGCGVQSLHLASHVGRLVATDVNRRALRMAAMNAAMNGIDLDLREGNLYEPVQDEKFDLVVTNPPFVISPATGPLLAYRDSGLPGDEVVQRLVRHAARHLRPRGWCQVLANWAHVRGEPWEARLTGWLDGSGCDAWVVQREVVDPAEYVEIWLRDAGVHGAPDYLERYDTWLAWFEEQGIEAVGFGWLNLRRRSETVSGESVLRLEQWPFEVEQPMGPEVAAWARRVDLGRVADDVTLLRHRLVVRPDVSQETVGAPGAEDPERIVVRQSRGMRRARQVDTFEAGLVGACDGDLSLGRIIDALSVIVGRDGAELRREYLPNVRDLLTDGFLEPSWESSAARSSRPASAGLR
ncbi:MAG: class I SAM-dependent methyltransferase [Actinomycetota bacterium]|nr:class I SAM-dependent methyltransferase [Actinomycetota bacterium]